MPCMGSVTSQAGLLLGWATGLSGWRRSAVTQAVRARQIEHEGIFLYKQCLLYSLDFILAGVLGRGVNASTKQHLIQTILNPTLCHQCQTWTLSCRQKRKAGYQEMRCLRNAKGVTRRDRIRNDGHTVIKIHTEIELVTPLCEYRENGLLPQRPHIQRQQTKWAAHLEKMLYNSIPCKVLLEGVEET